MGTPKKPVADIDLFIRASKVAPVKKVTGIKFQVRPKLIKQPSLIGRVPQAITTLTKEYLTSINWSQWNKMNQLSEINGSLVVEKAVLDFRDNYAGNSNKNVAGLLDKKLPTLIENALNNQSKEERRAKRNEKGRVLLDKWMEANPFNLWVKEKEVVMVKMNIEIPEGGLSYTEEQWKKAGKNEVIKILDNEESNEK